MERNLHNPEVYDYRQYDRIWQRVAPNLEPYPGFQGKTTPALAELSGRQAATAQSTASGTPESPQTTGQSAALTPAQEAELPGAEVNPCCMGTAAAEMLEVLTGFVEGELEDQGYYQAVARQAPPWARQRVRDIAADEGGHARRLLAVYFLITGECYRPAIHCDRICLPGWCAALRERYHEEACGGMNYARAAEGTTDPCLARLLNELSADEYRHADTMLRMLERSLRQ